MTVWDRFGRWFGKVENVNKVWAGGIGLTLVVMWLTGEWSPLP